jgi:hypothetical protein
VKRILVALGVCLILVATMTVPAFAAADKGAVKADIFIPKDGTVVGFAVFNTNNNGEINVEVAIKNLPENTYTLVVQAPAGPPPEYIEPMIVGKNGKANVHVKINISGYIASNPATTTIPCLVRINPTNPPENDVAHTIGPVFVPLK